MSRPRFLPVRLPLTALIACAALGLLACKADIPNGVYRCASDEDCPHGFSCRADDSAEQYCFSGGSGSKPNAGGDGGATGRDGGPDSTGGSAARDGGAGDGGAGSGASDGGTPPGELVAPTALGFSSGGERRSGPGLVLYDDGFERGGRDCSADGMLCVTGGFAP